MTVPTLTESRILHPYPETISDSADANSSVAALRQFTPLRLMAYGLEAGDSHRLLDLVAQGSSWKHTALEMAQAVLDLANDRELLISDSLVASLHHRASALQRVSQVMMLDNSDERKQIFAQASENYVESKRNDSRFEMATIESSRGPLNAWVITPATSGPKPVVLVHGGVDGWAMDWEGLALEIVNEGMIAVVLDGPGQGQTRFTHEHYLDPEWLDSYQAVCDFLSKLADGAPIGAVGNSMGAGIVALVASRYPIFDAVCSNGPVQDMAALLAKRSYSRKLATFVGNAPTMQEVEATFQSLTLSSENLTLECPFLLLQGTEDPMVSVSDGYSLLSMVASPLKHMALFEGGEHVINRYPGDKHFVIRAWLRRHLLATTSTSS